MKIWKKIFIYSLLLFIFVFNIAGIVIIENIYSRNLDNAIKVSISESKDIANTVYLNSDLFYKYEGDLLWKKLRGYMYVGYNDFKNITVYNGKNQIVMNTSTMQINNKELLSNISNTDYKFVIRVVNKVHYISVGYEIKIGNENFKIISTSDINYLWTSKAYNYKVFMFLSFLAIVILSIGLFIISKTITTPIEELSEISSCIKNGEYDKRSTYKSKDEIGVLAENFNSMLAVIDDNIEQLKDVNIQKQRFIDNLTHEMKTPITSILGYSDILLKGNLTEEMKMKALMNINMQGKRLGNLSDSLIKLVLMEHNEFELTGIKMNDIINDLYNHNRYKFEEKNIKFIKNIGKGVVLGNKELMSVLFNNLVDNAIKASSEKSTIKIIGRVIKENSLYELKFIDEGKGIPKEELKRIMEPFYMVDKARATKGKNMGLGLAICNDVCKLNKIEISLNSKVNVGTVVTLKFKMEKMTNES